MTEWMSKYGSGNAPISPRDEILLLQQEEEAALQRAEQAIKRVKSCDPAKDTLERVTP